MPEFIEGEMSEFGGGEKLSLKPAILKQVQKIMDYYSRELTPSYYEERPVKVGDSMSIVRVRKEDLRIAYCNAVDCLVDTILPEADEEFKDKLKDIEEEESEIIKEGKDEQALWDKIQIKKKIYRQIMFLFWRVDYFKSEEGFIETID